jgi:tRNA(Ile2) C34 agmatinyltransferase TiaS
MMARIRPNEVYITFEGFDGEGQTLEEAIEDLKKNAKVERYEIVETNAKDDYRLIYNGRIK